MKSVALFCAASDNIESWYFDVAHEVGTMLGSIGAELVYGGARFGLMEASARAAKDAGAHIVGVVPDILVERDRVSTLLDEKVLCRNLSERKDIMLQLSEVLVALPGGVRTLDEIFHVAAAATIGYHCKRVVLYNAGGFWNTLVEALKEMENKGFLRGGFEEYISVAENIDELRDFIEKA